MASLSLASELLALQASVRHGESFPAEESALQCAA